MKILTTLSFLFLLAFSALAQDFIVLNNPSFEGVPTMGSKFDFSIKGWADCGFTNETFVDIHPSPDPDAPFFGVTKQAFHGRTYVGMVTRDNDTWEAMGQRLQYPLRKDSVYRFSIYLAQPAEFTNMSRRYNQPADYDTPVIMRAWAGESFCDYGQLLGQTNPVDHTDWIEYIFEFEPTEAWEFIVLEAYYASEEVEPYNGSLLVDNCSNIIQIKSWNVITPEELDALESEGLTQAFVKKASSTCADIAVAKSESASPLPHTLFLNNVFKYEKLLTEIGARHFIVSQNFNEITLVIRTFENLGATRNTEVLKQLLQIYRKNKNEETLTEEEAAYFENAETHFKKAFEADDITALVDEYIDRHATQLLAELKNCY